MRLLALMLFLLALAGLLHAPHEQAVSLAQDATPGELAHLLIELTNEERAAAGIPPLKMNPDLSAAAAWMAQDMAANDYLGAIDSMGRTAPERIADFGYTDLRALAEHYAVGQKDAADVIASWMDSDLRRAAILDAEYREVGVGFFGADTSTWGSYWVQDLASSRNTYPVIINNEAATTDHPDVDLYVYGAEWADEMRLSHDGTHWTAWDPYHPEQGWQLEPGPAGQRTVFVELRGTEHTITISDSIELTVDIEPAATATLTLTPTPSPSPSSTSTPSPSATSTATSTAMPSPMDTETPLPTATSTTTPTATASATPSPTVNASRPRVGNSRTAFLPLVRRAPPLPTPTPTQEPEPQPVGTCLSADEARLAQLINDYRAANGLDAVPISKSLTHVGQTHVRDLHHYQPHTQPGCNLHSWSAQGHWKPVCYTIDHANASGMWDKPREVTGGIYSANGYENAYSTTGAVNPDAPYELWTSHPAHEDVILERGVWAGRAWPAMGVGIYEGYAVLWFGDGTDPQGTVSRCP